MNFVRDYFPVFEHMCRKHFLLTKSVKSAILFQIVKNVVGFILDTVLFSLQKVGSI